MKVVAVNGSPKKNGNTFTALESMREVFESRGIEFEIVHLDNKPVRGCVACGGCRKSRDGKCVFKDDVYGEICDKICRADGVIFGSPVYYSGIAGSMKSFMDRLFYSCSSSFAYKPVAAVCSLRRSGGVATFDQLNHYFSLSKSLIVPTSYWSAFHGSAPGEVKEDLEAMDCAKEIAVNMSWLLKVLEKSDIPTPEMPPRRITNFIR